MSGLTTIVELMIFQCHTRIPHDDFSSKVNRYKLTKCKWKAASDAVQSELGSNTLGDRRNASTAVIWHQAEEGGDR